MRIADSENAGFPDDSGGLRFAVRTTKEHREADSAQASLRLTSRIPEMGSFESGFSVVSRNTDESSLGVAKGLRDPAGLPPIDSSGKYLRRELHLWWRPELSQPGWSAMAGIDAQNESVTYDSRIKFGPVVIPALFKQQRETIGVVAEARYVQAHWGMQAGVRHDHTPERSNVTTPALSILSRCANDCAMVGATWSSASKLPSFYALAHPLVGNPLLMPEKTKQFELFYDMPTNAEWRGRVTLFSARFRDLVDFDAGPPPRLINRAKIESSGIELSARRQLSNHLSLNLNGMAMHIRDPLGGMPLRQRPEQQASAQLAAKFKHGWEGSVQFKYLGRRYDSSIPTGDVWLPSRVTLDASLGLTMGSGRFFIALDNALDKRFDEVIGTAASARRARIGMVWSL